MLNKEYYEKNDGIGSFVYGVFSLCRLNISRQMKVLNWNTFTMMKPDRVHRQKQ